MSNYDYEDEIIIKKKVGKNLTELAFPEEKKTVKKQESSKEDTSCDTSFSGRKKIKEYEEKYEEKNYDELVVRNNDKISYVIKKYKYKSIISIYEVSTEPVNLEKSRLILVKWHQNFYGENGVYLIELKDSEKYKYLFIGGNLIYEFNLHEKDSFINFKYYPGNKSYLQGKINTYFLYTFRVIDNDDNDNDDLENSRKFIYNSRTDDKNDKKNDILPKEDENLATRAFHVEKKEKKEKKKIRIEDPSPVFSEEKRKEFLKPEGLYYIDKLINSKMEANLIEFLDSGSKWKTLTDSSKSRKVQHYGYLYDYKAGKIKEKTEQIPKEFDFLINILKDNCEMVGILSKDYEFNQVIVNNYEAGQGISAHIDTKEYGGIIGCYTIGSGATMKFSKDDYNDYNLYVKRNSLYIMSGESRYKWKHEMSSRKSDVVDGDRIKRDRRISITFRFVPK